MKSKKGKGIIKVKNRLRNVVWFICFTMGIEALTFKQSYPIILGLMFIIISFIFFPWKNKVLGKFNVMLSFKQNLFIIIGCFISVVISYRFMDKKIGNWIWCFISFFMMLAILLLTILYSKKKNYKEKSVH